MLTRSGLLACAPAVALSAAAFLVPISAQQSPAPAPPATTQPPAGDRDPLNAAPNRRADEGTGPFKTLAIRGVPLTSNTLTVREKQRSEKNEIAAPRIYTYQRPGSGWGKGAIDSPEKAREYVRWAAANGVDGLKLGAERPDLMAANLLNIDVVALDGRSQPVTDLKPSEFELWINGYQIPIETVTFVTPGNSEVPRTIVLLLDDMAISPSLMPRVREAARRFVNQMSASDSMAIVSLNGDAMESTNDRARLLKAIDSYHLRNFPIRIDDAASHVLTTITALSRQMSEAPGGRKAIVALGTGWLFDTPIPPPTVGRDLRAEWVDAMRATASAHVSLYVIDPIGVGMRPVDSGRSGFARETGGHAFVSTNDINSAVDRILRETATYYVLSAQDPPIGRKADLREVEVKVLRRGVSVRARKGIPPGA